MSEPSPPGAAPSAGGAVSPNRTLMIVLAYLWILFLVPLLVEKEDREVQWHAKHGLVITVAEIVFWLAVSIVNTMLSTVAPGLGCIVAMVFRLSRWPWSCCACSASSRGPRASAC